MLCFDDGIATRTLAGIAGYYSLLQGKAQGAEETQACFVQRMLAEDSKAKVMEYEAYVARAAAAASVNTDITIT